MLATSCFVVTLILLSSSVVECQRFKRQLSPAVSLEERLPMLMTYGGSNVNEPFKRSPMQLKRHLSPSWDVEHDVGSLRTLLDVGKRQVSMADEVGREMEIYNRLFHAGKRALSPAHDLSSAVAFSDYLERAGRRK